MEPKHPVVSVIVPVWNTQEELLRDCVGSILAQSFCDFELLLIDDGSAKKCALILDLLAGTDERVRVIRQKNEGPASARNRGLEQAQGEYIAFVDSDDRVAAGYLADAVAAIRRQDADLVFGQAELLYPNGRPFEKSPYEGDELVLPVTDALLEELWLRRGLGKSMPALTGRVRPELWAKLYRRTAIGAVCFDPHLFNGEDQIFNFEVLAQCQKAGFVPRLWYRHRMGEGSVQNGISGQRIQNYQAYFESIGRCSGRFCKTRPGLAALRDAKLANSMMECLTPYACGLPLWQGLYEIRAAFAQPDIRACCRSLRAGNMRTGKEWLKWLCCRWRLSLLTTLLLRRKRRSN